MSQANAGRRRRSSSIIYQEPPESIEHTSDQAALPNLNANWVNAKGTFRHLEGDAAARLTLKQVLGLSISSLSSP